jgi:putative colanic acid biosynthesis glycosyltransferase
MSRQIKILQINSVNFGSTGSIIRNITKAAEEHGYVTYFAYADSRSNRNININNNILIGNVLERNLHLQLSNYTGYNGCFSISGTKKFLKKIGEIKPDVIHLHNLHNCYINLKMLFNYIKEKDIPVVWTLHDCWAFTGQCPHFSMVKCDRWKTGCFDCPQYKEYPSSKVDRTKKMYSLKKEWFTGVKNLTIITPSKWLADKVKESYLGIYPVQIVNNGIDLSLFQYTESNFRERYGINNKKMLLGVASTWNTSKGLDIFIELSKRLNENFVIVLVGLSVDQIKTLPHNIIGLTKTKTPKQLSEIYSAADWFVNPSRQETMGLVTIESLACGTPAIVSNLTAVPEIVDSSSGIIVENCDSTSFYEVISNINNLNQNISKEKCIERAQRYDMYVKYKEYIDIFKRILIQKN